MDDNRRNGIEQKNLRFSSGVPRNKESLTTRLGPPSLTASEMHGLVTWQLHRFAVQQDELDRARDGEERERPTRLERFLRAPVQALPCFSPRYE